MIKRKYNSNYLHNIIHESLNKILNENSVVTFNGEVYPNFGWCIFLAGNGGSGKGFVLKNLMPIDGRVINVDDFKEKYAKMFNGIYINGKMVDYDSHNPEHVKAAHIAVRNKGWKHKTISNAFNDNVHDNSSRLPNIIFDMVGKEPSEIIDLSNKAKKLGYKTMLVWVVTTRHHALLRNLERPRQIPDEVLHTAANELSNNMPKFLGSQKASICLNDAWLVFNSTENIDGNDLVGDLAKTAAVRLNRGENGFDMDEKTKNRLMRYLGKNEENPKNPTTYMSSREIASNYGKPKYRMNNNTKKNEFMGYDFDRSQFTKDSNLFRK